jgi:dTMP kinase
VTNTAKLIVFEGPDGVGKSTLMKQTEDLLKHRGILFQSLSPGKEHGTLGGLVDLIHHDPQQLGLGAFTPLSLQALHIAAHLDHIEARIISRRAGGVRSLGL